jgi:hypothetical protein
MKKENKKMYRRLCSGLADKGKLIPVEDNVFNYINNLDRDYYLSLYMYNEEQKKRFYEKKDDSTINGAARILDVVTDKLVFDFDDKENLEHARQDTLELCDRLKKQGIETDSITITFSGNKGFGVEAITDQEFTPEELKQLAKNLAGDLKTFDPVIFNASRIIRVPFTKHQESSLYKTVLEYRELETLSIKDIQGIAKIQYEEPFINDTIVKLPKTLLQLKEKKKKKTNTNLQLSNIDLSKKPKWLSNWKFALTEGYFPPGMRNSALMIIAATYRGNGQSKLHAYHACKAACEYQSQRFDQDKYDKEELWKTVIEVVYGDTWEGGTYAEENFPDNLKEYLEELGIPRKKGEDNPLVPIDDIFNTFENFAENIDKNTIKTGISDLDKMCRVTTSMLVGVLGAPGAGKTATILNILNNHSLNGEASVFFSLDMGKPLVYQKMAQKFTGYSSDRIFDIFKNRQESEKEKIRNKIEEAYSNVQMCFRTGSTVDDMKKYIESYEEQTGKKVRLIAVDYLEKIVGPFSDSTANSGYNAAKLQELANELEICVLLLLQPQKMAGDPSEPLLTYRRVKGASVIEQDCRVIFSVFREGYDPQTYENDRFITYSVLKNTMGELGSVDCFWSGLTGDVSEIDDYGREELKAIRRQRMEKKKLESL